MHLHTSPGNRYFRHYYCVERPKNLFTLRISKAHKFLGLSPCLALETINYHCVSFALTVSFWYKCAPATKEKEGVMGRDLSTVQKVVTYSFVGSATIAIAVNAVPEAIQWLLNDSSFEGRVILATALTQATVSACISLFSTSVNVHFALKTSRMAAYGLGVVSISLLAFACYAAAHWVLGNEKTFGPLLITLFLNFYISALIVTNRRDVRLNKRLVPRLGPIRLQLWARQFARRL